MGLSDDAKKAAEAQRVAKQEEWSRELAAKVERDAPKLKAMQREAVALVRDRLGVETSPSDWPYLYSEKVSDWSRELTYHIEAEVEGIALQFTGGDDKYSLAAYGPNDRFFGYIENLADFGEALLRLEGQ